MQIVIQFMMQLKFILKASLGLGLGLGLGLVILIISGRAEAANKCINNYVKDFTPITERPTSQVDVNAKLKLEAEEARTYINNNSKKNWQVLSKLDDAKIFFDKFDVIIIGSGSSGLRAADEALRLGKKVLVISNDKEAGSIFRMTGETFFLNSPTRESNESGNKIIDTNSIAGTDRTLVDFNNDKLNPIHVASELGDLIGLGTAGLLKNNPGKIEFLMEGEVSKFIEVANVTKSDRNPELDANINFTLSKGTTSYNIIAKKVILTASLRVPKTSLGLNENPALKKAYEENQRVLKEFNPNKLTLKSLKSLAKTPIIEDYFQKIQRFQLLINALRSARHQQNKAFEEIILDALKYKGAGDNFGILGAGGDGGFVTIEHLKGVGPGYLYGAEHSGKVGQINLPSEYQKPSDFFSYENLLLFGFKFDSVEQFQSADGKDVKKRYQIGESVVSAAFQSDVTRIADRVTGVELVETINGIKVKVTVGTKEYLLDYLTVATAMLPIIRKLQMELILVI